MVKRIIRKLVYGYKADSESMIAYLRKKGARIGSDCIIFEPTNVSIDLSRPYLLEIGNKVQITKGVTILTHGYDWSVFKGLYGSVLGKAQKVVIGDNVFVGRNATIMGNVHIGNNVIIGANAVVTKDIPENSVVAGNPARVISSLEDYYKKRMDLQLCEAKLLVCEYYKAFGTTPPREELREFFWLFTPRGAYVDNVVFDDVMNLLGNREESYDAFNSSKPLFENYEAFLDYCMADE